MEEFILNADTEIIAAELEHFYHFNGGVMRLPRIARKETHSDFIKYELADETSVASITLRPTPQRGCKLAIYCNDSERYAWMLGIPGYSELGKTTILGLDSSERCQDFCDKFAEYLDESGYLVSNDRDKLRGGRPPYEENKWAQAQYSLGRSMNEVYLEWLDRRKKAGRAEPVNSFDSFKKVINKK